MRQDLELARRTGAAPRVNLLPLAIVERRRVKRQRVACGTGFVLLLSLLALVYVAAGGRAERAGRAASSQRAVTTGLETKKAGLQPWATLQAEVAESERLQASVYAREIRFSDVLQDVSTMMPDNAWLTQMAASVSNAGTGGQSATGTAATARAGAGQAAAAPPGAPGSGSPVASITFSGMAFGHVDVGRVVRALDGTVKRHGQAVYLNPFFTSSQRQSQSGQRATVTFSASVDLGPAAFSGRFQRPSESGGR